MCFINRPVFVTVLECVYWAVGHEALNKIQVDSTLEKVSVTAGSAYSNHWTTYNFKVKLPINKHFGNTCTVLIHIIEFKNLLQIKQL
jgi:hypothetical protein